MPSRIRRFLFGPPKDVRDPHAFHKLSLVALLAWVGLGADGLSSSAYGPDEEFRQLGEHQGLLFFLALAAAATVFIISYGYSRIIEQFPSGGGGYVVASKLLSPTVGVVSGSALLVDYVLTLTTSLAGGADAIFSMDFLPRLPFHVHWHFLIWDLDFSIGKLPFVFAGLAVLTIMNIRGVKESVTSLVPIFGVFLVTHAILLIVAIGTNVGQAAAVTAEVKTNVSQTVAALGLFGTLKIAMRAYSLGGGTYTGIEAVSNGVGLMREPRVKTAKRTMVLMAVSLAITAGGILLAYQLTHCAIAEGKTMNAVLLERVAGDWKIAGLGVGTAFVVATLFSEGALLFVAAQTGFIDGPRVMANMATDSWLPHRFAALSDRLSMRNGIWIMSIAGALTLLYTGGDVGKLVTMYSINVFVTFSLSNLAMIRFWFKHRAEHERWIRHALVHVVALVLCVTILLVTVIEKFSEGGWLTLVVTSALVAICFAIKRHYNAVVRALRQLDQDLPSPPEVDAPAPVSAEQPKPSVASFEEGATHGLLEHHSKTDPDTKDAVAILMVGGYSGLGRHALLTLLRMFPFHFKGVIFVSVAVVDSESFKGADQVTELEKRTRDNLLKYERYAQTLEIKAASAFAVGTEVAVEAEKIAEDLVRRYPKALFVAGQLIFEEDTFWTRALHNETAFMVQKRLQRRGVPMIVVPVRVDLRERRTVPAPKVAAAE